MKIEQFYDKGLAHASYAIISEGKMALVDPARDPHPYYDFAKENNAEIVAVFETHPHADFVSSHVEIAKKTGATIYVSQLLGADYDHKSFDDGDELKLGKLTLRALNTPGHSPDSVTILLLDENGKQHAAFTGDALFVGDVGRPDLRENVGNLTAKREELAKQMYQTTNNVFKKLDEEVLVYPAHGAGSLCGKSLSSDTYSTIGREKSTNYALQDMSEDEFIKTLLQDQPFIPKYFGHDVSMNKAGAISFEDGIKAVPRLDKDAKLEAGALIVDTRPQDQFKKGHLPNSINIQEGGKFETWLGSIVGPTEKFYLIAENEEVLNSVIRKSAKIGYEGNIKGALLTPTTLPEKSVITDVAEFRTNPDKYTIVDIRNTGEVKDGKIFESAVTIPLPELRERLNEIPKDKPLMVHCAAGYRSAAGQSILEQALDIPVYDLSDAINSFKTITH
ncbi:MBL fold metallo-hydrolase [Pontibacter sp. BT310]|uniref:MBL fold metallo-hydrolase n=1 Tax=Pontibacter populi TaxID=890055 RepID=A0ABS6X6J5_9BACT|nr:MULTISPECIES: MBL fold metallo-hydrolase [Pontibacter]MBJ6116759.1 MBL fold metallo-hydrolase [Pontibacter sp. BT310]MBR0569181.1 MBL fold metallo-hydrolase [Microvirga sp. STS03]MBW3363612.1 MBL fold metallo-hydrolase [Pontibacter populi]